MAVKVNINGLTLYKPKCLAVTKNLFYGRDNIPMWFAIYHLDVTSNQNDFGVFLHRLLDRDKEEGEIAWIGNGGNGDKKGWWKMIYFPNCNY